MGGTEYVKWPNSACMILIPNSYSHLNELASMVFRHTSIPIFQSVQTDGCRCFVGQLPTWVDLVILLWFGGERQPSRNLSRVNLGRTVYCCGLKRNGSFCKKFKKHSSVINTDLHQSFMPTKFRIYPYACIVSVTVHIHFWALFHYKSTTQ